MSKRTELIHEMEHLYTDQAYSDQEIARRLQTDRTNIYKIRRYMSETMNIDFIEEGNGRYRIDKLRRTHYIPFKPAELLALYLGGRRLQQQTRTGQTAVANALQKLSHSLKKPLATRLIQAAQVVLAQEQDVGQEKILEVLVSGWLENRCVRIQHRKHHGQLRMYTVQPYQLEPAIWSDAIYLLGHSDYHNGLATFKVSRIEQATLSGDTFTPPADFDSHTLLQHAWGVWHADGEPVQVSLRFTAQVAPRVRESIWHPSQTIQIEADGRCLWQAQIAEWQEMEPWVRGWGADVEVLEPLELRRNIERHIIKCAKLYGLSTLDKPPALDDEDYDDKWANILFRGDK